MVQLLLGPFALASLNGWHDDNVEDAKNDGSRPPLNLTGAVFKARVLLGS